MEVSLFSLNGTKEGGVIKAGATRAVWASYSGSECISTYRNEICSNGITVFFPFLFFVLSIERQTVSCTDGPEPETD
jgi:hypothetical protein